MPLIVWKISHTKLSGVNARLLSNNGESGATFFSQNVTKYTWATSSKCTYQPLADSFTQQHFSRHVATERPEGSCPQICSCPLNSLASQKNVAGYVPAFENIDAQTSCHIYTIYTDMLLVADDPQFHVQPTRNYACCNMLCRTRQQQQCYRINIIVIVVIISNNIEKKMRWTHGD